MLTIIPDMIRDMWNTIVTAVDVPVTHPIPTTITLGIVVLAIGVIRRHRKTV